MGSRAKAGRFPWAVAGLLALALVAGVLSLVRVPVEPEPAAAPVAPIVELSRMGDEAGEQMLSEEVALLDPRPLFLPTERNAGQAGALSDDGRREPSASFENFPAQLNYKEEVVSVSFPAVVEVPSSPVKALRTDQGRDSMGSFGRRDQARPSLPPRLNWPPSRPPPPTACTTTRRFSMPLNAPPPSGRSHRPGPLASTST